MILLFALFIDCPKGKIDAEFLKSANLRKMPRCISVKKPANKCAIPHDFFLNKEIHEFCRLSQISEADFFPLKRIILVGAIQVEILL